MIWPGSLLCGICAVTAEERAFVEESTQVLHFLNELADINEPFTPLKCVTIFTLKLLTLDSDYLHQKSAETPFP